MKNTFRQSMTWLHTWSGLLLGWVLFAIFVTGTATYFKWEITRWMQPELQRATSPIEAARVAVRNLEKIAGDSSRWLIELPDERTPATTAYWQGEERRFSHAILDPVTGEKVTARDSRGGEFFYRFHFQLQLPHPWGRYLAGLAAMFMFVALISGVITHRQFFKDFFVFRPGRAPLRSFLDFHNVTAVLALPFYFMISYSALVIFMSMYLPWARLALEGPATSAATRAAANVEKKNEAGVSTPRMEMAPFDAMLAQAAARWGDGARTVKRVEITGRGTAKASVVLTRGSGEAVSTTQREQLRFNGLTGELLPEQPQAIGSGAVVHGMFYGLHVARFAGPALRWLFFVMGIFGSALVATGLVMWTIKRRAKAATLSSFHFGQFLVERLNVATIAGLFVAIGAFFWANRLLPVALADRADLEVRAFHFVWATMLLHALARRAMKAWREQLWLGAGLLGALPLLDALTGPFLKQACKAGDTGYLAFHATVVFTGALLSFAAIRVARSQKSVPDSLVSEVRAVEMEEAVKS